MYNQNKYIKKFINFLMIDGKKEVAENILHNALLIIRKVYKKEPNLIFLVALQNAIPHIGLTRIRIRGKFTTVPVPLNESKKLYFVMKWFVSSCRTIKHGTFAENLAKLLIETANNKGKVIELRKNLYKEIQKNRNNIYLRFRKKSRKYIRKKK